MLQSLASAAVRSSVEARRGRALASADSAQTRSRSAPKRTQTIGLVMNGVYFKAANTSARLARIFQNLDRQGIDLSGVAIIAPRSPLCK
jgi:hypothetical protein